MECLSTPGLLLTFLVFSLGVVSKNGILGLLIRAVLLAGRRRNRNLFCTGASIYTYFVFSLFLCYGLSVVHACIIGSAFLVVHPSRQLL